MGAEVLLNENLHVWGASRHLPHVRHVAEAVNDEVNLPGIFPAEAEIIGNLLECGTALHHDIQLIQRIRAVLFLKVPAEFIRRLDIKLVTPVRHRGGTYIKQNGNLSVSKRLRFYFPTDKPLNIALINFQCTPPEKRDRMTSTAAHEHRAQRSAHAYVPTATTLTCFA